MKYDIKWPIPFKSKGHHPNGVPAVLVHCVVLIGHHSIVRVKYFRWRCVSLVRQSPISL